MQKATASRQPRVGPPTPPVPMMRVNRIQTPPKDGTTSKKYKIPRKSVTIYNSKNSVPSKMVVKKETVYRHQKTDATSQTSRDNPPADRRLVVKELKDMLIDVVDQQVELATMRMRLDDIIKRIV